MNKKILLIILVLITFIGCVKDKKAPVSEASSGTIAYTIRCPPTSDIPNITLPRQTMMDNISIQFYPTDDKSSKINYTIWIQDKLLVSKVVNNGSFVSEMAAIPHNSDIVYFRFEMLDKTKNNFTANCPVRFIYDFESPSFVGVALVFDN